MRVLNQIEDVPSVSRSLKNGENSSVPHSSDQPTPLKHKSYSFTAFGAMVANSLASVAIVLGTSGETAANLIPGVKAFDIFHYVPSGQVKDALSEWLDIADKLTDMEKEVHKRISEDMKRSISAGISTEAGIYGCTQSGPNGAWPQENSFSWCDKPEGTLHNIIFSVNDRSVNHIEYANVVNNSFGITTRTMILSSMNCQAKGHGFYYTPWVDGNEPMPNAANEDCVFNFPVCYTQEEGEPPFTTGVIVLSHAESLHSSKLVTRNENVTFKAIKKKIEEKGWTTPRACRHTGGLPIQ
ncbi:hypothetical protein O181_044241 [Austropuccinia psidii MF-1]|uniref:DUF7872 domain-containing protein n=1 Tax=Austropuccinia psidii MF-1 TaxID=1389203 RepID=A0A9Q3DI43_9BASI|nr:hypothetical protein [Austropuccinia psidii MF-1]